MFMPTCSHVAAVKRRICERQGESTPLPVTDGAFQPDASGKIFGHPDILVGEINARYPATAIACEVTRCPAETAADIEQAHSRRDPNCSANSIVACLPPIWNSSTGAKSVGGRRSGSTPDATSASEIA